MDDSNLGEHDPFRALKAEEKAGYTPDFSGGIKGPAGGGGPTNAAPAVDGTAARKLNEAEQAAAEKVPAKKVDNWSDLDEAKNAEEKTGGFYSGVGKELGVGVGGTRKKAKAILKKGGPVALVVAVFVWIGVMMFGTQAMQLFSAVAQFTERFNSMHTSANMRSNAFFKAQMSTRKTKSPYGIFGKDLSISKTQQEKLKEQGIEFDDKYEIDGKKTKVLKYTDADGTEKIVTADNFKEVYSTDTDFFKKYNAGSVTWRGKIASWFNTTTKNFLENNNLTRNMWEKWKEKLETAGPEANQKELVSETIEDHMKSEGDLKMRVADEVEEEDENGNSKGKRLTKGDETPEHSTSRTVNSEAEMRSKLDDISGKYNAGANAACAVVNTVGAITLLVTAKQSLEIINETTSLFEAVDKAKAGYDDETPIMVFANAANEKQTNTNVIYEDDGSGKMHSTAVITNKSAMEAAGVGWTFGGGKLDPEDPSVQSFNVTGSIKKILGGVGVSMSAFRACTLVKMSAAIVSGALDAVGLIACLATGVGCIGLGAKIAVQTGIGAVMGAALSGVVGLLVPKVANVMLRNLVTEFGGENLGNAWTYGAILYQGSTHRANGGGAATLNKYIEFAAAQEQVIADNAKYERETLSPFDMTSKNTFMGALMTKIMSLTRANSLFSTMAVGGSVVSSSLMAMTPAVSASAYDFVETLPSSMEEYEEYCPFQASVGAIGAANCPTYTATDMSTINSDPDEPIYEVEKMGGFDGETSDGNPIIKKGSMVADYIDYCSNRTSPLGIVDQNIANAVGGFGQTGSSFVDGAIGSLQVIGDAIEIVDDAQTLSKAGYINGAACVIGNNEKDAGTPSENQKRWIRRYLEDQSYAEAAGIIPKSAVTAYLEEYYKEHPLDNSYEGILARYSGLTKENVIALLDVMDYANYIADYDPSDRYMFGDDSLIEGNTVRFDNENVLAGVGILLGRVVYADVRNRSFAA